jgi:hypothetical protein
LIKRIWAALKSALALSISRSKFEMIEESGKVSRPIFKEIFSGSKAQNPLSNG